MRLTRPSTIVQCNKRIYAVLRVSVLAALEVLSMFIILRAIRGIIGLIGVIYFAGAYQALRVTFVDGSSNPDDILTLIVKSSACLICFLVFSALRKLINYLHMKNA